MTGGLMQIAAYGAQDIYLTGNPLITYFKMVYRRHTNFSMESIEQTFESSVAFGKTVSALIPRNGDLMTGAYIQAVLPDMVEKALDSAPQYRYTRWIDNIGHYLIKEVSISIGGQEIDKHYSDWLEIWSQLTVPAGQMKGYLKMIGQDPLNNLGQHTGLQKDVFKTASETTGSVHTAPYRVAQGTSGILKGREIYVPLQFWFCRDEGLALPLISLQHHEVKIHVEFRPVYQLVMINTGDSVVNGIPDLDTWSTSADGYTENIVANNGLVASLWIDYIYLDSDERRKFAQVSHEYLIDQLQFSGDIAATTSSTSTPKIATIDLNFDHPVKELIWVVQSFSANKEFCNYTNTQLPIIPPFTGMGYDVAGTGTNITGLTGLPTGLISHDLSLSVVTTVTTDTAYPNLEFAETAVDGVTITATNVGSNLRIGDIITLNNNIDSNSVGIGTDIYATITAVTSAGGLSKMTFPIVTHNGDNIQYDVLSIFRPTAVTTLNAAQLSGIATNPSNNSLTAVQNWNQLNRLTNYNMIRPVNNFGLARNPVASAQIKLNGFQRFEKRPGEYFNWVQCKEHHTNIPKSPGINVYSFALKPEDFQPSGSCNFSRIDNVQLILELSQLYNGVTGTGITNQDGDAMTTETQTNVKIYAVNHNILRIMSGMGGLAYRS
jgi:hypothetical protein